MVLTSSTVTHADSLVLRADQIEARITAEIELAPRLVRKPTSFAPDVWFGATSRVTIGLIHSNASLSRIDRAASYCFEHDTIYGCDRTYHNAGLDVRYAARRGTFAVAPRARLLIRDVDPWKPAVTAGALLRWQRGRFAVTGDPYLRLGLYNTDRGNRTALFLPVEAALRVIARIEVVAHTGYNSDLAVWHDGFHIPLALAIRARMTDHVELGSLVGFTSAVGPQDTVSRRTVWFWVGWRS